MICGFVFVVGTYMPTGILDLSSRSSSCIGLESMPNDMGQVLLCHTPPLTSTQSPMITMSKDSNNIEEVHALLDKEDHPEDFDVNNYLVVDDIDYTPPSNLGLLICEVTKCGCYFRCCNNTCYNKCYSNNVTMTIVPNVYTIFEPITMVLANLE